MEVSSPEFISDFGGMQLVIDLYVRHLVVAIAVADEDKCLEKTELGDITLHPT